MDMSYGTNPAKLDNDVERMQAVRVQNSLSELISEVKLGRSLMMMALFVSVLLCASTFTMVVLATKYSSDTVIVGGVMTDKATNNVVSTAEHNEIIAQPLTLNGAQGVKRVTISRPDGSLISHRVESASRVSCKSSSASHMDICNEDGFHYLFETGRGTFVGTSNTNGLKFTLVDDETVNTIKGQAPRAKVSKASGKSGF